METTSIDFMQMVTSMFMLTQNDLITEGARYYHARKRDGSILAQGNLISFLEEDLVETTYNGTFVCQHCGDKDEIHNVRVLLTESWRAHGCVKCIPDGICPIKKCRTRYHPDLEKSWDIVDTREMGREYDAFLQNWNDILTRIAKSEETPFVYIGLDWTMKKVVDRLRARRVLRALRRNVNKNHVKRVAYFLVEAVGLDENMATVWTHENLRL